jgi:2-polyprenyl-3-methyl-5-hydroxy-6-metoxy-1,4-benzoquinol methylase
MSAFEKIPVSVLTDLTDVRQERNIYVHPNPIAREIFWQRLSCGYRLLEKHTPAGANLLDFGGGSGAFLPSLARRFARVAVIDLDLDDARRIAQQYRLNNVRLIQQDAGTWNDDERYDVVTAMDVLEHFADPAVPYAFFDRYLKPGGFLLVSLPTENLLYELGRVVLRKQKPADHYHPARKLVRYYTERGYAPVEHCYAPRVAVLALPLFYVGVFRKKR